LSLSIDALLIIEQQSSSPEDLQKNLEIVDECGNKGLLKIPKSAVYFKCNLVNGEDACTVAAGIYQCGKEKAPAMTDAIQSALTNNAALAGVS